LVIDELNVKQVEIAHNEEDLVVLTAKPNLRVLGPKLGKDLNKVRPQIESLGSATIVDLQNGKTVTLDLNGSSLEIGINELFIQRAQKEGIVTESQNDITVALDIHITDELKEEGFAREFINKIQQTRKELDFEVTDRIKIHYSAGEVLKRAIDQHSSYIKTETLTDDIVFVSGAKRHSYTNWLINDENCSIKVEKL
jgi:isoleucyl-tRNA synthetase